MLIIDGSLGEGGGQVLRSSLALSLVTGTAFRLTRIRAGRKTPGLRRQHVTAVAAAAEVSDGDVVGGELGSRELTFRPRGLFAGRRTWSVGSAGSVTLVLQTVLPALVTAGSASRLEITGGTHAAWAPPFDFLERAFLPLLERMGPRLRATLERPGFHPHGGGAVRLDVEPAATLARLDVLERGALRERWAVAWTSRVPDGVARRELAVVEHELGWPRERLEVRAVQAPGPGNALVLGVACRNVTEVFSAVGRRGLPAEAVARTAVGAAREWLESGAAVGVHLADQLLVPMALAGGGAFRSLPPTPHALTNAAVIRSFVDVEIRWSEASDGTWVCRVGRTG